MQNNRKPSVIYHTIDEESAGQRIDNFLLRFLKGVPKDLIYRIVRKGEIRVNKGRVSADYRLLMGDIVRIPPVRTPEKSVHVIPSKKFHIVFEDDALLVIDKPPHVATHGGSGIAFGVIEQMQKTYPNIHYLRLAHRLDKETSGLLMMAKKRSALVRLHEILRQGLSKKYYYALAIGCWPEGLQDIQHPLLIERTIDGKKRVKISKQGCFARTVFRVEKRYDDFTLLSALLKTGRTHQIRVHMQHAGYPIAGDAIYGDFARNKVLASRGLKRLFLHAYQITLPHPISGDMLTIESPLAKDLKRILESLNPIWTQSKHRLSH